MPRSDHGWPPGPRTVTRRRTDPTPAVLIASSIWPSTATNAPTSRSSSSALAPRRSPRPSSPTVAARTTGRVSVRPSEVAREVEQRGHRDRVVPDPGRGEAAVALRERDLGPLGEDGVEVGGEDDRVRPLRAARRRDDVAGLVDARRDPDLAEEEGDELRPRALGERRRGHRADAARVRDDAGGGAVLRRRHGACILSAVDLRGTGPASAPGAQPTSARATASPSRRPSSVSTARPPARASGSSRPAAASAAAATARTGSSAPDGQPLREAHAEHDPLRAPLGVVEALAAGRRRDAVREARRVGPRAQHVPPPHGADVRVRARPDAPPVRRAPVADVVTAARGVVRGPVRDLVPAQAGVAEQGVRRAVALGEHVVLRRSLARRSARGRACACPVRPSARRRSGGRRPRRPLRRATPPSRRRSRPASRR